jgi:hypothetical protein
MCLPFRALDVKKGKTHFCYVHRLLSSFQNNLDEITIIATPDDEDGDAQAHLSKAVQLHSFLDPAKGMEKSTRICLLLF